MITDKMLAEAALELDRAILASLPNEEDCDHVFSEFFERKMKKLIRRTNHTVAYKVLRYAACVIISFMLAASALIAFNTDVRAAVVGWVQETFEGVYHYFFPAENRAEDAAPSSEHVSYSLGWVPDGYTLIDSFEIDTGKTDIYLKDTGDILQFTYAIGSDSYSVTIAKEGYEEKPISPEEFGIEGILSLSPDNNQVSWIHEDGNIVFTISGLVDENDLIKMAQSVNISK